MKTPFFGDNIPITDDQAIVWPFDGLKINKIYVLAQEPGALAPRVRIVRFERGRIGEPYEMVRFYEDQHAFPLKTVRVHAWFFRAAPGVVLPWLSGAVSSGEIKLPCFDMVIRVTGAGGTITSRLCDGVADHGEDFTEYDAAAHAIESLVLAHACAGVDVRSEDYVKGIKTAVDAINNKYAS